MATQVQPGDVVSAMFAGAVQTKPRPLVVVSTTLYHQHRPDVILAVLTTHLTSAQDPTDYALQDWAAAGLYRPSAFRVFLGTYDPDEVKIIGHLTKRDWQEVQARLRLAIAVA